MQQLQLQLQQHPIASSSVEVRMRRLAAQGAVTFDQSRDNDEY